VSFVFSIPFESADLGFTSHVLTISKVVGLVFVGFFLFFYNPLALRVPKIRAFPGPPTAAWWLFGYIAIYIANGLLISEEVFRSFVGRLLTLVQLIFLFCVVCRLLEDTRLLKCALLAFSAATVMVTLGMLLNVAGFSQNVAGDRETALGQNANVMGGLIALGAVILIGLSISGTFKHTAVRITLALMAVPVLLAIAATGSRAAISIFIVGSSVYLLQSSRRVMAMTLAACAIGGMAFVVIRSPTASTRWQMTFEEGHLSGRDKIFAAAAEMFLERPMSGWRPYEFQAELGTRVGQIWGTKDAHNLYFHVLLEVGLVGAGPFFVALVLCGRAAWRARKGTFGLMPLALLLTMLAANMSGTWLVRKPLWFVLAVTVASESALAKPKRSLRSPTIKYLHQMA
jgi:O-antigen ligase